MMKNEDHKQQENVERPFALEFLETVSAEEQEKIAAGVGNVKTQFVSIFPRPDFG